MTILEVRQEKDTMEMTTMEGDKESMTKEMGIKEMRYEKNMMTSKQGRVVMIKEMATREIGREIVTQEVGKKS